ncbi:DUF7519 family protein [Halorarum salinum]|uniref:Uncharacterized protein n=1 Tax=Halorarum salinum TaxID=2743089 RepID=A0A7D5Q7Q2_9EURY|nr:hypothetical protein [Halobaculum salinum]QLG60377.1 hypothetical protein HUG12_00860 [Halobaculum salinum]
MTVVEPVKRPTVPSGTASVLVAGVTVWLLAPNGTARLALVGQLATLGVLAGGFALFRRDHRPLGVVAAFVGLVAWVGALAVAATATADLGEALVSLPGMAGLLALALALAPLRGSGSRGLLKLGAAGVTLSVLAAGLFGSVPLRTLLVCGAATFLAWDLGENAVNVGEQLGRRATTRRLEAAHGAGSLLVGGVAVGAGTVVSDVGSSGLPLPALALLLASVLLLAGALHG